MLKKSRGQNSFRVGKRLVWLRISGQTANGERWTTPQTVHDINVLTVVRPPQSYKGFVTDRKKKLPKTSLRVPSCGCGLYFEGKNVKTGDLELVWDKTIGKKAGNGS